MGGQPGIGVHRGGTRDALEESREFYERWVGPLERRMMRCVWRVVRNADAAETALQEAMAVIWKRREQIPLHPNPEALILKICSDKALDELRKRSRLALHEEPLGEEEDIVDADVDLPPEVIGRRETEDAVREAMSRLPRNQALAAMMRLIEERSYEDIAGVLECDEATVRTHVKRARTKLALMLRRFLAE